MSYIVVSQVLMTPMFLHILVKMLSSLVAVEAMGGAVVGTVVAKAQATSGQEMVETETVTGNRVAGLERNYHPFQ